MKILVVDDEMNIRNVVREYAEHEGFKVDEAGDGMEAVSMAKAQDYDLIVMDVMMPRLDGFSACKEIRKTKDTPIIILSARDDEYDQQRRNDAHYYPVYFFFFHSSEKNIFKCGCKNHYIKKERPRGSLF